MHILRTLLSEVWIMMQLPKTGLLFCVVKWILIQQSGNVFCTHPSDKLFHYHWMCSNTSICPGSTGEAALGEGSKIRSNRAQSGFKECPHTCTQWCRGTTWLVMLFSAFKETATSEATQGAAILALGSGVTWLSFHFVSVIKQIIEGCVILPHRDYIVLLRVVMKWIPYKKHIVTLLDLRERGRVNKCCYLLQISYTTER